MDELRLQRDDVKNDSTIAGGDDVTQSRGKPSFDSENLIFERDGKFDFVDGDQLGGGSLHLNNNRLSNGVKEENGVSFPPINKRPKSAPTRSPSRPMPRRPVSAAPTQNPRSRVSCQCFTEFILCQ